MSVCLASLAGGVRYSPSPMLPVVPPPANHAALPPFDRVIRLNVEYDQALAEQHGERAAMLKKSEATACRTVSL